jgi:hypothetical protein
MERFRGGLVFNTHRVLYHSTLGSRVIKKKEEKRGHTRSRSATSAEAASTCTRFTLHFGHIMITSRISKHISVIVKQSYTK